ncbi:hypothetical protein [Psychromonas sp. MME1]|uniref:hypothetical protein n=1 Tax=Psychromonas sp. MME1 TaxID=3231032 RepID=UPI0034E2B100
MRNNILVVALSLLSYSVAAEVKTVAHNENKHSEVRMQNIGDTACVLTYKNSDYLTTEGMPVFYTFQAELKEGELQKGMQSWLPYGIKPGEPSTLAFYDKKIGKIYEYADDTSVYGELFYKKELFDLFLAVDKIQMRQGGVTIDMPVYNKIDMPAKTVNAFKNCIKDLDVALKKYCKGSKDASKLCLAKIAEAKKVSVKEVIKDDPEFLAAAKIKELEKSKLPESTKTSDAKNEAAAAAAAKKAFDEAVALEVAKALKEASKKAIDESANDAEPVAIAKTPEMPAVKKRKILDIYTEGVSEPYRLRKYAQYDTVSTNTAMDGEHGQVSRVRYSTNKGVAYFDSSGGIDYSDYNYLEFDLKLVSDPRDDGGLFIKMDCFHPCNWGRFPLENLSWISGHITRLH